MRIGNAIIRPLLVLPAAILLAGCSAISESIPAVVNIADHLGPVFILEPSNTPFLPARDTETPVPTDPPTATFAPAPTQTSLPTIPWTPIATEAMVILPSVTPVTQVIYPTATKAIQHILVYPTATKKVKTYVPPTEKPADGSGDQPLPSATATGTPTATVAATSAPTEGEPYPPPDDTDGQTPTETPADIPPPAPTATQQPSATPLPTVTPIPTATRTNTPVVPKVGCATYNFDWEAQMADMLNQERAKNGLPPWRLNSILTGSARAHSVDMVVNKFMSHTGSDGSTPQQRILAAGFRGGWWGEIIAGGTPTVAVNWWMNEPGHRAMIINTHYTDFGVGYAYCPGQGWFTVDQGGP
jgi:uncharacterized protein YkwD